MSNPGRRNTVYLLAAVLWYALANYLSGRHFLPGCSFAELRPQVCLPIFMGIYFGPLFGFVTGALGDSLGYLMAGTNPLPIWHWALANGLMGGIAGLARYFHARRVTTLKGMQTVYLLLLLSTSLPFLFSSGVEVLLGHVPPGKGFSFLFLPIFITDAMFAIILMPLCMLAARLLVMTIPTGIFLMTTYLTSVVVLCTFAGSMITVWGRQALSAIAARDLYMLGMMALLVIIVGFAVAAYFVRRITHPILELTAAADSIAQGQYEGIPQLNDLKERSDELGRLASAFKVMLSMVRKREETLKAEVRQLHIEIDSAHQKQEVSKIVGSDYFKALKSRADQLRIKEHE